MMVNNIQKELLKCQDDDYKLFVQKLIPNCDNIIGVRTPLLKKMAKEIAKNNPHTFIASTPQSHEENILQALVIAKCVKSPSDFQLIINFIPQINNWAVCDTFCTYLKSVSQFPNETLEFLSPYLKSTQEFEVRFALVLLLFHFVEKKYLPFIFKALDDFNHQEYYAQMGGAWLLSICFIKYPEQTLMYLKKSKLETQTFNRAIQKICESTAVSPTLKITIKRLKRPF